MSQEFNIFDVVKDGEKRMQEIQIPPPYSLHLSPENMATADDQIAVSDRMVFNGDNGAKYRIGETQIFLKES